MTSRVFPGGWYVDALPSGEFVALIRNSHFETHRGRVELPINAAGVKTELLQIDLAPDGIHFAGKEHTGFNIQEWDGIRWHDRGFGAGNNACLYDATGHLHIVPADGTETGSLGWWYAADHGELIPTWWVYNWTTPFARANGAPENLWLWTRRGDVLIGQGNGGVVAHVDGRRHQIADGQTTFIKYRQSGDRIALSWVREDRNEAHVLWLTAAELTQFPRVASTPSQPPPLPPPPPPPPVKELPVPLAPNHIAFVSQVIAEHPEIDSRKDGERGQITQLVAGTLGPPFGRKDRDQNPSNDNNSDDALTFLVGPDTFEIYDILDGTTGAATWDYKGTFRNGENGFFRAVQPPVPDSGGNPSTPLPNTPSNLSTGASLDAQFAAIAARFDAQAAEIAALKARPVGGGSTTVDGVRVALRTDNGHYLVAEGGGGGDVNASREQPDGWETFTLEVQN